MSLLVLLLLTKHLDLNLALTLKLALSRVYMTPWSLPLVVRHSVLLLLTSLGKSFFA